MHATDEGVNDVHRPLHARAQFEYNLIKNRRPQCVRLNRLKFVSPGAATDNQMSANQCKRTGTVVTSVPDPNSAFKALCDWKTSSLRLPLGHPQARAALRDINHGAASKIRALSEGLQFNVAAVLVQGACLLMAVFKELGMLESAWCGPPAELRKDAVHVLKSLKGTATEKVTYFSRDASMAECRGTRSRPTVAE